MSLRFRTDDDGYTLCGTKRSRLWRTLYVAERNYSLLALRLRQILNRNGEFCSRWAIVGGGEREKDECLSDDEREYKTAKLEDIEDERRVEDKLRVRTVELETEVDYGYSGPYIKVR